MKKKKLEPTCERLKETELPAPLELYERLELEPPRRPPDPKCPRCSLAQKFGRVIYCACMK
jgi:hypothetical protein